MVNELIGGLMQIPKAIGLIKTSLAAKKALKKLPVVDDVTQVISPEEQQNLANYQNAYNTGMLPGQAVQQQQIIDTAGNTGAAFSRNASSGTQRMLALGGLQGQRDFSMRGLGADFGQQRMGLLGGLSQGLGRITQERDKVFADQLRKYQENQATRAALQQTRQDARDNYGNMWANLGGAIAGGAFNKTAAAGAGGGGAGEVQLTPEDLMYQSMGRKKTLKWKDGRMQYTY